MIALKSLNLKVLVTGATGFIGSSLVSSLSVANGVTVRAAVRNISSNIVKAIDVALVSDIGSDTNWSSALMDIQVVVHTCIFRTMLNTLSDSR
jgi:nucleoside-diphosphate-sugar epimerase